MIYIAAYKTRRRERKFVKTTAFKLQCCDFKVLVHIIPIIFVTSHHIRTL